LLFVAGRPKITPGERLIREFRLKSLIAVMFFLCYCALHVLIDGSAWSLFKLESLTIGIIVAYALSYKTIRAIKMHKNLFFIVGFLFGLAAYYAVFSEIKSVMEMAPTKGLRSLGVATLNVQDYYIVLFLYATALLFGGSFRCLYLLMFVGTATLCVPIVIGLSSRMVPFTVGVTIMYMIVVLQSVLSTRKNILRNILILSIIAIGGMMFIGDHMHSELRIFQVFTDGPLQLFVQGPRYISFAAALRNFWESPLYGIGFGNFVYPGEFVDRGVRLAGMWPHNIFLELLSELGLIGFFLFVYATGRTFLKVLLARFKSSQEFIVLPCLLLIYTVVSMQLTHNLVYPFLWVGYFCCDAAFHYNKYAFPIPGETHNATSGTFVEEGKTAQCER